MDCTNDGVGDATGAGDEIGLSRVEGKPSLWRLRRDATSKVLRMNAWSGEENVSLGYLGCGELEFTLMDSRNVDRVQSNTLLI